jgi:hypothetical protein
MESLSKTWEAARTAPVLHLEVQAVRAAAGEGVADSPSKEKVMLATSNAAAVASPKD